MEKFGSFCYYTRDGLHKTIRVRNSEVLITLLEWDEEGFSSIHKFVSVSSDIGVILITNLVSLEKMANEYPNKVLEANVQEVTNLILNRFDKHFKLLWRGRQNDFECS